MIFHWPEPEHHDVHIPVGGNITGLVQDALRPTTVELSWREMQYIQLHPGYIRQLKHVLRF